MKKTFWALLLAMVGLSLRAQEMVVYDASDLVDDRYDNSVPHFAVLTRQYYESAEWQQLQEKIEEAILNKSFTSPNAEVFDREGALEAIRELEALGYKEDAEEIRRQMAEHEKSLLQAQSQAGTGSATEVLDIIRRHAVGGRLFYSADLVFDDLAKVRNKSWDEVADNAWGLMDASGRFIVPCRYYAFWSLQWDGDRAPIIMASRITDPDKETAEVSIFRPDGTLATKQKFAGATNYMLPWGVVGVCFRDGGWGLMDNSCRILTTKKYMFIRTNANNLIDASQGTFIYGERGGVNYILSPIDGSEIGTFKLVPGHYHDVNYYPGKDPRK